MDIHAPDLDMSVTNLTVGEDIYAIQIVYGPVILNSNGDAVIRQPIAYSVRDAYVWPSNGPPQRPNLPDGDPLDYERIGTFAYFGHHSDATYAYRVCSSPYLSGTQGRYEDWVALIEYAMTQWEQATQILTTTRHPSEDCAELFIASIGNSLYNSPWSVLYTDLIAEQRLNDNNSEIRVVEDFNALRYANSMTTDIFQGCLLGNNSACVTSRVGYEDPGRHAGKPIPSTDISFKQSALESDNDQFNLPQTILANTCRPTHDPGNVPIDYELYETMLHEIGHAFGLSNVGDIRRYIAPENFFGYSEREEYAISHPTIFDSIMNYPEYTYILEKDCSPYPMDIMAIYALYQNLP